MYPPGAFEPDTSSAPGPSHPRRRPWSPNEYEEDVIGNHGVHDYFVRDHIPASILPVQRQSRRQLNVSSDSVEALDLADYTRTLRRVTADIDNPYPPFPHTSHLHPLSVPRPVHAGRLPVTPPPASSLYPEYPSSPVNSRPFSAQSRDTFNQPPPSLISGDTSHDTHDSLGSNVPYPSRRPYYLPSFLDSTRIREPPISSATSDSFRQSPVQIASPIMENDEIDISRFPAFSRNWYDDPRKTSMRKHTSLPPYLSDFNYDHTDSYTHFSSAASAQSRNILPWGPQLSEPVERPVDDSIKEERMRMLQHEFGKQDLKNEGMGKPVVGSVNEKGALITAGPKKRSGARWAQGILALATAVSSLYGALFVKSPTPPPPASKPPAFALYGASVFTFFLIFYLFALRPCFSSKRKTSNGVGGPNLNGMMVLPVQRLPGGKKAKKKKGKKNKNDGPGGDVQVNLIIDPGMFGGGREEGPGSDRELDDFDGSQVSSRREGRRDPVSQRRGVFQGLAMEEDWKAARKFLTRMLLVDITCMVGWGGVFALILFGQRCPPGGFNGWCDSYNIASATACTLLVAFGFSVFFDIIDLHASKSSPRTRT